MRSAGLRDRSLVSMFHLATAHAALGERDAAFHCLGEACAQRGYWAALLAVDPRLDPLRDDPRYAGLLDRASPATGPAPTRVSPPATTSP